MIILALVVVALRFRTINWVLGGGRSSKTGGGSSRTEGRLFGRGEVGTFEADGEESSWSRDHCLSGSHISSVIVTNKEETSSSAGKNCI